MYAQEYEKEEWVHCTNYIVIHRQSQTQITSRSMFAPVCNANQLFVVFRTKLIDATRPFPIRDVLQTLALLLYYY